MNSRRCTLRTGVWFGGPGRCARSMTGQKRTLKQAFNQRPGTTGSYLPTQLMLESQLLSLCRPFSNDETAPQAKLCRRIERFIKELFVFVSHPDVPSENNAAERSLRHLVISRKISGGTRSEQGTTSKMALASLFAPGGPKVSIPSPNPANCSSLINSEQLRSVQLASWEGLGAV